jgi:hypothetical protein
MKRSHQSLLGVHMNYPQETSWNDHTDNLHKLITWDVRTRHLHEAFIREACMRCPHERLEGL